MQEFIITLIVFCSVASAFGEEFGAGGGNITGSRDSISISRPKVVVRPEPLRPVIVIHRRPIDDVPIIQPVNNPVPLYTVVLNPNSTQVQDCIKNDQSIYEHCHSQVTRSYDQATLNSTWRSCCSTFAEASCYINNAGQYCSSSGASALIKHSLDVGNYFSRSICLAIPFTSWESTCSLNQEDVSKNNNYTDSRPAFIALPTVNGHESITCLDQLRAQPEGDLTKRCMNASFDAWDFARSKLATSQVYESCCAMYDVLECLQSQAKNICTDKEFDALTYYKTIATKAFSQGVCRSVPYASVNKICRGHNDTQTQALEKRAVELVESHKKALKQLQDNSQGLVVSAIESELILVEALITQLSDTSKPLDEHHLLLLEEQLIRHEFKLTEQITAAKLAVIELKKKDEEAKKPVDSKKQAELVEKANDLIKKGTDALVRASSIEISPIQLEIHEIETLIRAILAKPSVAEFKEDELLLEEHERALQILIDRLKK